jgi:iron complex outermembrane receptor protein
MSGVSRGLILICISRIATAGEPTSEELSELEHYTLEELMVVTASKQEQPIAEAPSVTSMVNAHEIDDYGWTNLNSILYRLPGFAPSQDFYVRTVSARGAWEGALNNHLLLLFDGVPYNEPLQQDAMTEDPTPLFMVKSVEVVRGPGSALYGSNAANGIVAINSVSPTDPGLKLLAKARLGNAGTQIYDALLSADYSHFAAVLGFNYNRTDGNIYRTPDGSGRTDANGALSTFTTTDARQSTYFFAKLEAKGPLNGLSLQFHNIDFNRGSFIGGLFYAPSVPDQTHQARQILTLKYQRSWKRKLTQEYVLQFQRDGWDWNIQAIPSGFKSIYPAGLWERILTNIYSAFARAQLSYRPRSDSALLAGVEDTLTWNDGDDLHTSNADLAHPDMNGNFPPFANNATEPIPPWLERVIGKPMNNFGFFAQYYSGRFLRRVLAVTLGLRIDDQFLRYFDMTSPARPVLSRNLFQVSPRLAIVAFATSRLSFKLLGGESFREPSLGELFGENSIILAGAPEKLQPELLYTTEAVVDWDALSWLSVRGNGFFKDNENQIGFSPSNAYFATNYYAQKFIGAELELNGRYDFHNAGVLSGFCNYSYVTLLSESIQDPAITPSHVLPWYPGHIANLGLRHVWKGLHASVQGHVQSQVYRRPSDFQNQTYNAYRPAFVAPYATVDARVAYSFRDWFQVGVQASNLTNTAGYLVKTGAFPFDYRIEGIRVLGTIEVHAGVKSLF